MSDPLRCRKKHRRDRENSGVGSSVQQRFEDVHGGGC